MVLLITILLIISFGLATEYTTTKNICPRSKCGRHFILSFILHTDPVKGQLHVTNEKLEV